MSSGKSDWSAVKTLFPYLLEFPGRIFLSALFLILAKAAGVTVPLVFKHIVDALDGKTVYLPVFLLLVYGFIRFFNTLFGELKDAVFAKVTQRAIRRVAMKVFLHLHALSLRFHLDRQTGGMSRDIERGTKGISFLLNFMLFNIIPTIVEILLVAVILLSKYDVWFAIIICITLVVYIGFTLAITEWRMTFRKTMNDMDSKANTRAIDSLLNYETVKYFSNESFEAKRYDESLETWEDAAVKSQTSLAWLNAGQSAIIAIGITILMWLAARGIVDKTMTMGDLVLVNAYMLQLYMPLNFLGFVYREIRHSLADMEKMFGLLDEFPEVRDREGAKDLVPGAASVRFEHVDFSYETSRRILRDVDFEIPPGKTVAVVGHSGSGKSTLARLLFRFYEADGGRVLIEGQDIRNVTQKSLRSAIGIVPQDTVLFNDSIYYNIAYGRLDASPDEVMEAAKMAHIHDFVVSLPQGYETLVGERGLKLSGGEKQRVAIARTILKAPALLIFDEATSALDSKSEKGIQTELKRISANRTTLVIAHRLSTIVDADRILVMDKGRIIEQGSHRELLDRNGTYAHMWALQQQEEEKISEPADNQVE
ncbi:MAG: ABC transporter ATP-binding protein/permease [Burkholderiales bacterium]|nr:ABC transporter ATP-binding protein/permease [Burkholderiales bacterium]